MDFDNDNTKTSRNRDIEPESAYQRFLAVASRAAFEWRWELAPVAALLGSAWLLEPYTGQILAWLVGGLAFALLARLWWLDPLAREKHSTYRRMRKRLRSWDQLADDLGLTLRRRGGGDPVAPKIRKVQYLPCGVRFSFDLPASVTALDFERLSLALAGGFGAVEARVERDPSSAARCHVEVIDHDPLPALSCRTSPLLDLEPGQDPLDGVTLGQYQTSEPLKAPLYGSHTLICGATGSGKSVALLSLLSGALLCRDTALWLLDPTQADLSIFEESAARYVGGGDPESAVAFLRSLDEELTRRQVALDALRRADRKQEPKLLPSPDFPLLLVAVEELRFLLATDKKNREEINRIITRTVMTGRKFGVHLILVIQRPDAATIGEYRDQFAVRLAHRVATTDASDVALGSGIARDYGIDASEIPVGMAGTMYAMIEGARTARKARTFDLSSAEVHSILDRVAGREVEPESDPVAVAEIPPKQVEPHSPATSAPAPGRRPSAPARSVPLPVVWSRPKLVKGRLVGWIPCADSNLADLDPYDPLQKPWAVKR